MNFFRHKKQLLVQKKLYNPLLISFAVNVVAYNVSRLWTTSSHHINMAVRFDSYIHVIPWTTAIYLGSYIFWIINYLLGALQDDDDEVYSFLCADVLAKLICLVFFTLLPTTTLRPVIVGTDFWSRLLRMVYRMDAADNLFPSIHCLTSQFCFIAVRKCSFVPRWYKIFSIIAAALICISTLTTKQHVLADVLMGIALAEASYGLVKVTGLSRLYSRVININYQYERKLK
ncbi:PAP2 superfamily protein [Lachnospiraceae bacterium JC7]|nr:PAP2 superfamily protein [Lachnospiraceae bacterium JC7]